MYTHTYIYIHIYIQFEFLRDLIFFAPRLSRRRAENENRVDGRVLAFIPVPAGVPTRGFLQKPTEEGAHGSKAAAETKFLKKKPQNFDFPKSGAGV